MKFQGPTIATAALAVASLFVLGGCEGGSSGDPDNRGPFTVSLITTGQGQIYPYRIRQLAGGQPTTNIVNIESIATLEANLTPNNSVLPVAAFPTTTILPDGNPGNQYVAIRFTHKLAADSILSNVLADLITNSGLTTSISLVSEDPFTESSTVLQGQGFVGGFTYVNRGGSLEFIKAVEADDNGALQILESEANGFPRGFSGEEDLVNANTFVFVADTDDDLTTFETFDPGATNQLIRIAVSSAVKDTDGAVLEQEVCTATTVGSDPNPPDVIGFTGNRALELRPTMGSLAATDPQTQFTVRFNKPVQPGDVGTFFSTTNLTPLAGGVRINMTLQANNFDVTYYADPLGFGDFCNYRITPAYLMPDETDATLSVTAPSINGLQGMVVGNDQSVNFRTTIGPGLVNAPVAPDAIYVGIGGSNPGVAVIDLNGFGQSTSSAVPIESSYALGNPNVGIQGVTPSLDPGTSGLDAGSKGFLSFAENSNGERVLLGAPTLGQVGDIHIGAPLDLVYNNQNVNVNASSSNQVNPSTGNPQAGNCIAVAPHPNPPKLVYPPPNLSRLIFGQEPNVNSSQGPPNAITTGNPPCAPIPVNQLTSGNVLDYYPRFVEGVFNGPQPPPPSPPPPPPFCQFTSRQQIGHFLYVLDQENDQILVVNSNRFTILDTINLTDPFNIAFSPTLAQMAVTNFASSKVAIIDTDPRSAFFNTVIAETTVATGPTACAWQPDGEAIIVLSTGANVLSVVRAGDFSVVSERSGSLNQPFDLAVTPRYVGHGNTSNIYYAYVLNGDGSIAIYESGPDGTNGIGFDDIIGDVGQIFRRATNLTFDPQSQFGGVYVTHVDDGGLGVVSRLELTSTPFGAQPTSQVTGTGFILPPTFRNKEWTVTRRYGGFDPLLPSSALLSGNSPIAVVFDDMLNFGAFPNQVTAFAQGLGTSILGHSAKGGVLQGAGGLIPPSAPRFLFVALADVGKIDVFDINTSAKLTTLDIPSPTVLATYWRQ